MTEEIIIDGANVAGCVNFVGCNMCNDFLDGQCEGHNCEYKQLKRLEQERDEWKKKYEDVANENLKEIYELIKKNDCWRGIVNVVCSKLEQENKELGRKVFLAEQNVRTTAATFCDKDNKINELEQENRELKCELEQLKQSLKN